MASHQAGSLARSCDVLLHQASARDWVKCHRVLPGLGIRLKWAVLQPGRAVPTLEQPLGGGHVACFPRGNTKARPNQPGARGEGRVGTTSEVRPPPRVTSLLGNRNRSFQTKRRGRLFPFEKRGRGCFHSLCQSRPLRDWFLNRPPFTIHVTDKECGRSSE